MKLGTIIKLPDGRIGTVVYNSLIGVGIKWGTHYPDPEDFAGTDGNTTQATMPQDFAWEPDALLREPEMARSLMIECVGTEYIIVGGNGI